MQTGKAGNGLCFFFFATTLLPKKHIHLQLLFGFFTQPSTLKKEID